MITALKYLAKQNRFTFHSFGIIVLVLISAFFGLVSPEGSGSNPVVESLTENGVMVVFVITVILGPVMETLIFQAFPHWIIHSVLKMKKRHCIYLVFSSVLFGISHFFNVYYFICGTIVGLLLSFLYDAGTFRKDGAILSVTFIHGIYNLFVFLLEL